MIDKHTHLSCTSIQNASFHGASTHKQYTHKGFHAKAFPVDTMARDAGKARTKEAWVKAAKTTRAEEMKEAIRLLNEPDLDGDQILLLVQVATEVMGEKRVKKKTSIFFDKGSTYSMVTKSLVEKLELEAIKRTLIVHSFRHTEAIDTEYVVIELLKTDGTVAHIRAYDGKDNQHGKSDGSTGDSRGVWSNSTLARS